MLLLSKKSQSTVQVLVLWVCMEQLFHGNQWPGFWTVAHSHHQPDPGSDQCPKREGHQSPQLSLWDTNPPSHRHNESMMWSMDQLVGIFFCLRTSFQTFWVQPLKTPQTPQLWALLLWQMTPCPTPHIRAVLRWFLRRCMSLFSRWCPEATEVSNKTAGSLILQLGMGDLVASPVRWALQWELEPHGHRCHVSRARQERPLLALTLVVGWTASCRLQPPSWRKSELRIRGWVN